MPYVSPQYPDRIWDGLTPNEQRITRSQRLDPDPSDWDQIVAEMISTQTVLNGVGGLTVSAEVLAGQSILPGQPVAVKQADAKLYLASIADEFLSTVCGFCVEEVTAGSLARVILAGKLELSNWVWALNGFSNLTPGAIYYLSATDGKMDVTPPLTGYILQVGVALTTTVLSVSIKSRIRL